LDSSNNDWVAVIINSTSVDVTSNALSVSEYFWRLEAKTNLMCIAMLKRVLAAGKRHLASLALA
jgi:hypothetical protein